MLRSISEMSSPSEAYRNKLRAAGITPDKPLFEVLDGVHEAIERLREPISAEDRVAIRRDLVRECARALATMRPWVAGGALATTAAVFLALGWWLGSAQPVATPFGSMSQAAAEALVRCDFGYAWDVALQKPVVTPAIGGRGRWVWCWEVLPAVR
jgi:hypothetical protein